ncbi:hypothetical protein LMG28614_00655 [Paraburkholderia ultramafica]|uniref:Uncharacterized protein n=1 Tax=Paraburkholderia ultramafica TaxID=1544867 RepID=A0A6S7C0N5_9BURK|nr:hypothetical protein [Paraburkholderia ultramafica]CAB3778575.1 hypothetical protein LMG28614_00655 [Paraburkholderia ultramafica]
MTNTGKVLIIGLLVIDLGVAGYLLFPKDERRPAVTGTVTSSAITAAADDSVASETHVVAGSVVRAMPPAGGMDMRAVVTPAPAAPKAATVAPALAAKATTAATAPKAATVTPAPAVATIAPDAGQAARHAAIGSQPVAPTVAPAQVQQSAHTQSKPVMQAEQTRGRKHDDAQRSGSNQVSAALTAQLVKESAKPDPSLPLPPNSSSGNGSDSGPTGRGSNPVASAMTDQLVRESSKVTPSSSSTWQSDKR